MAFVLISICHLILKLFEEMFGNYAISFSRLNPLWEFTEPVWVYAEPILFDGIPKPIGVNCIPSDRRISVSICYQAPEEDLFAEIRKKGWQYKKVDGVYTFCNPIKSKRKESDYSLVAKVLWNFYSY